jgi:hypothetical protein
MMFYARRYGDLLASGRLAEVAGLRGRRMILSALSNLSKYNGEYPRFRQLREASGLRWSEGSGDSVFFRLYSGEEAATAVDGWLDVVKGAVPWDVWFPIAFLSLTGMRTSEGVDSLNLVATRGLDSYLDMKLGVGVLQHFMYPSMFLKRTKKVYISVIGDALLRELREWHSGTTYSKLRSCVKRRGLECNFYGLRRLYATNLRMAGLQSEVIDMLQGRLRTSDFVKSYLRYDMKETLGRVRDVMAVHEKKLLC